MGDFDREGGGRSRSGGGGAADPGDWDRTTQEFLRSISRGEQQQQQSSTSQRGRGGGAEVILPSWSVHLITVNMGYSAIDCKMCHMCTGWQITLFKTPRWLQNKSFTLAWLGQAGTFVLKSLGGFKQREVIVIVSNDVQHTKVLFGTLKLSL